jgi:phosphatidylglycerophosphate synthase
VTISARGNLAFGIHPPTAGALFQFALLAALAAGVGLGVEGWLAGTGYALASWFLLSRALRRSDVRGWGPANTVTLVRLTLAGGVTALVADSISDTVSGTDGRTPVAVLTALAAVALLLDAVDGQVARRTDSTTRLGARFDMEADSVLVLVLSGYVAMSLGWWVLAIGAFRYLWVALSWCLPWLRAPLAPRMSRKVVAALQGIVLVVASAGILPRPVAIGVVALALASLVWSFGTDLGWLWQRATRRGGAAPATDEVRANRPVVQRPVVQRTRLDAVAIHPIATDLRALDQPVASER